MSDGYRFDQEALDQISKGINLAMAELKELGFDIEANLGRGFDELELAGLEVGDDALASTFADFCDRWGWGVRSLMQDANEFTKRLGLSAGMYHEQEQYVSDSLKNVFAAAQGDPHKTKEQVDGESWNKVLKDNMVTQVQNPDYSQESAQAAQDTANKAWGQTWQDLGTSTVTPDAFFDDDTDWQWDGPPESASEAEATEGDPEVKRELRQNEGER
ncbi:hypothetical protein P8605_09185 [Streptomyces sp. T-3]|nr:hypothetical protein [Streptomyces sp. T-3]